MKNPFIFLLAGLLLMIAAAACTDLEEEIVGELTEELTTEGPSISAPTSYFSILDAIYSSLRYAGTANHGSYFSIQEITTDEIFIGAKGNDWYDGGSLIRLHQHTFTPSEPFIANTWTVTYREIASLNEYLSAPFVDEEYHPELRGMRAYHYWRLLDLFGHIKIITETDGAPPQATRQEAFQFVEEELLSILGIDQVSPDMDLMDSLLPEAGNPYRLSPYGVLGLLAKLYLNAEVYTGTARYEEAEIAASFIINSGHYQLCGEGCSVPNLGQRPSIESDPDRLVGYAAVFAPNNDDNPEHIFAVNYDEFSRTGMNFSSMNLHYGSQLTWGFEDQPWNGYAVVEDFYNSYDHEDVRKEASFLAGPQLDFTGSAVLDYQFDDDNIVLNYTPDAGEIGPNSLRQAGVRARKFSFKVLGRRDMNNDFPLIRLGEMYLIRAEAKARQSGSWTDAEPDVNVLRARAGVTPYSGNLTEDEFLAERGREMFHELSRRTDLIRFGRFTDSWWEKPASLPFRNIFPIPQEQINADPNLTQNAGY